MGARKKKIIMPELTNSLRDKIEVIIADFHEMVLLAKMGTVKGRLDFWQKKHFITDRVYLAIRDHVEPNGKQGK